MTMCHLRLRTEFSFRKAFGRPEVVLAAAGGTSAAITDAGTWGHVSWYKACKAAGIKPIYGVEIFVCKDARDRQKQGGVQMAFIARNNAGLRELYELVTRANDLFYYVPRIDYRDVNAVSSDIYVISGSGAVIEKLVPRPNVYLELNPSNPVWNRTVQAAGKGWNRVVCCDNHYPAVEHKGAYEIISGRDRRSRTTPMHILGREELELAVPQATEDDFMNTERIAADCNATLPSAEMVKPERPAPLYDMCIAGAKTRGISLTGPEVLPVERMEDFSVTLADPVYQARLMRELDMIEEKQFEDYFYVIADMVAEAKKIMFVGPARGSSAGSLVCYLLGITDVDPIVHDLMFERFIDVTRADLPDIDIDFPDIKRDLVIEQLRKKYGEARVGRIGTVARYKAKSCIGDVAKQLNIPPWETKDVKDAVVDRSTGDARAQFCVKDALEGLDIGKALLAKYPALVIAADLEGHATHSGTHAAGVIVSNEPLNRYCSRAKDGASQIDKKDAEALNMLKIDVLGLRTLSVLQDALDQVGKPREWLINYPLTDTDAFEVFNAERYSGIFQFEGYALQSLTRQMKIHGFDDIVAIGALSRPGPLHCGATTEYIARRVGRDEVTHMHPLVEPITGPTYGTVVYQEQVMSIGRVVGQLSWEDVSELRKAMSKSLGEEFFNKYWVKFEEGAVAQNIPTPEARRIWDKMCTFGSWAFNKSHAVSYGLLSYWCAVLKAHYPLQFAAACLRNAKDEEQSVKVLRELVKEGFEYKPVDIADSGLYWSVVDGKLLGGLTNIKGLGEKKAQDILTRRAEGRPLQPGHIKLLANPVTPYDDIFEGQRRFGDIYINPKNYNITSGGVTPVQEIGDPGDYVFIARIKEKNLRDLNEYGNLVKRAGRRIAKNSIFLNLVLEDDTGSIIGKVGREQYPKWGKPLIESAKIGEWFLWKGKINADGWRLLMISRWRRLEEQVVHPTDTTTATNAA